MLDINIQFENQTVVFSAIEYGEFIGHIFISCSYSSTKVTASSLSEDSRVKDIVNRINNCSTLEEVKNLLMSLEKGN